MLDVDTFLTALYVMVDDFCHSQLPKRRPGPQASLSDSEVITLAILRPVGPLLRRARLLPLRSKASARRLPHLARSLAVQSAGALVRGSH